MTVSGRIAAGGGTDPRLFQMGEPVLDGWST
jgi:hypothetical protein